MKIIKKIAGNKVFCSGYLKLLKLSKGYLIATGAFATV
jgi:hypothetical protein